MSPEKPGSEGRVLLVLPDQWERALLRAELIERGVDAMGAPDFETALEYPARDPERGPVRAVLVDQRAIVARTLSLLRRLLQKHGTARVLLLGTSTMRRPRGPWESVISRPIALGDLASTIVDESCC